MKHTVIALLFLSVGCHGMEKMGNYPLIVVKNPKYKACFDISDDLVYAEISERKSKIIIGRGKIIGAAAMGHIKIDLGNKGSSAQPSWGKIIPFIGNERRANKIDIQCVDIPKFGDVPFLHIRYNLIKNVLKFKFIEEDVVEHSLHTDPYSIFVEYDSINSLDFGYEYETAPKIDQDLSD